MFPYLCQSYKDALREGVRLRQAEGRRLTFQSMAAQCRIQKTYLSKVLNHDAHLSEDQLYLALECLGLDEKARAFVLLLFSLERTQVPNRKQEIEIKIKCLRHEMLKTEAQLDVKPETVEQNHFAEYFLDPILQIVHMHLTINKFAASPDKIAANLGLKPRMFQRCLAGLAKLGLIAIHGGRGKPLRIEVLRDSLHLPQDSFLQNAYASRMRIKAMERMENLSEEEMYRFSVVFSANAKVREQIHASFMKWLKETQKLVQKCEAEAVYQMNFDLLGW